MRNICGTVKTFLLQLSVGLTACAAQALKPSGVQHYLKSGGGGQRVKVGEGWGGGSGTFFLERF